RIESAACLSIKEEFFNDISPKATLACTAIVFATGDRRILPYSAARGCFQREQNHIKLFKEDVNHLFTASVTTNHLLAY
ncbi:hypothetical protein, partial [Ruegeria lacuscaerulensis]|uniref:hypothetical protein n=1 Tax=Ruegeria lacuscaerulensis TaxID=55218 RepID=UPI001BE42F95